MEAFQIQDTRYFMSQLLTSDTFYPFEVTEASLTTFCTFHIDGLLQRDYFDTPPEPETKWISWQQLQPRFHDLIRGKHTPLKLKIALRLSNTYAHKLLNASQTGLVKTENVNALCLNILYEHGAATLTTGVSLNIFTMDKTAEHLWDETVEKLLRLKKIPFQTSRY